MEFRYWPSIDVRIAQTTVVNIMLPTPVELGLQYIKIDGSSSIVTSPTITNFVKLTESFVPILVVNLTKWNV